MIVGHPSEFIGIVHFSAILLAVSGHTIITNKSYIVTVIKCPHGFSNLALAMIYIDFHFTRLHIKTIKLISWSGKNHSLTESKVADTFVEFHRAPNLLSIGCIEGKHTEAAHEIIFIVVIGDGFCSCLCTINHPLDGLFIYNTTNLHNKAIFD